MSLSFCIHTYIHHHNLGTKYVHHLQKFPCIILDSFLSLTFYIQFLGKFLLTLLSKCNQNLTFLTTSELQLSSSSHYFSPGHCTGL